PTASLVVTREGRIIEANPAAVALLDTGQDELTGRELLEFLKPEVRVSWSEMLRNLNDGEPSVHCNVPAVDGSDQAFALRLSAKVCPEGDAVLLTFSSGEPVLHDLRILQRSQ
ncbi:MAG: PAS domain-containing protein, partial [Pseudomonadota bacterium]